MNPDGYWHVLELHATYEDFARSLGVDYLIRESIRITVDSEENVTVAINDKILFTDYIRDYADKTIFDQKLSIVFKQGILQTLKRLGYERI